MDKIGKCCDFVSNNSKYNVITREDEDGFITVEKQTIKKEKKGIINNKNQPVQQMFTYNQHVYLNKSKTNNYRRNYQYRNYNRTKFVNAGSIHSEWQVISDVVIPVLDKKTISCDFKDLGDHGEILKFDNKF